MKNAKQQFRTSIQSIWSEYSLQRDKSSEDKKVEDTVFASFRFESFIVSFARKRLGVTSPELIDVDKDLSKCKIVFPLWFFWRRTFSFVSSGKHYVYIKSSTTIVYIS